MDAVASHDIIKLINYISDYCGVIDSINLLRYIDNASVYYDSKNTDSDKKAWHIINKIYLEKNGISIENSTDEVMKVYSNELLDTNYDITGARSNYHAKVYKNYFVNIKQPYISLEKFGENYGTIFLDDKNNVESGVVLSDGFYSNDGSVVDENGNVISEKTFCYRKSSKNK